MSVFDQARDAASSAASAAVRQARITRKQVEARRLAGKIDAQKLAIGNALLPSLEDGSLTVESPAVNEAVATAQRLQEQLESVRAEIDVIRTAGDDFEDEEEPLLIPDDHDPA